MSDATRAPADGGRASDDLHPLGPLVVEHLAATREQTARIAAIEGAVDLHTTRAATDRPRIRRRLLLAAVLGLVVVATALNPGRAEHQAEVFAALIARGGPPAAEARELADSVSWRRDGYRLIAIDRLNLGIVSIGLLDEQPVTLGVWGQVFVFDP